MPPKADVTMPFAFVGAVGVSSSGYFIRKTSVS